MTFDYSGPASATGYKLSKVTSFMEPEPPDDGKVRINGTEILEVNDLAGLIQDKTTGKGIPGVIVTDGYNCTKTDEKLCMLLPLLRLKQ